MGFEGTFKVVDDVVKDADRFFADTGKAYTRNKDVYERVAVASEAIDWLIGECDGQRVDVSVDETTTDLLITVTFPEVVIHRDKKTKFFSLLRLVDKVGFKKVSDDVMATDFVIRGVWNIE